LWNKNNECEVVPIKTFASLSLNIIIIISSASEIIQKRLERRDGVSYKLKDIIELQSAEINQAKIVADKLKIPLMIYEPTRPNFLI
jgi:dephospho-CoA kinase